MSDPISIEQFEDNYYELKEVAEKMAQDLQEYVTEGERGGSDMRASKDLLSEFDEVMTRIN